MNKFYVKTIFEAFLKIEWIYFNNSYKMNFFIKDLKGKKLFIYKFNWTAIIFDFIWKLDEFKNSQNKTNKCC
jgi:hypothetical protein